MKRFIEFLAEARNPKIPVYTRQDLMRMGKMRKDATLNQIWPAHGKPHPDAFYFDMGNGDHRPSLLVHQKPPDELKKMYESEDREHLKKYPLDFVAQQAHEFGTSDAQKLADHIGIDTQKEFKLFKMSHSEWEKDPYHVDKMGERIK